MLVFNPNLQFSIEKLFKNIYNLHLLPTTRIAFSYLIEKTPHQCILGTINMVIKPTKQLSLVKSPGTFDTFREPAVTQLCVVLLTPKESTSVLGFINEL